MVNVTFKGENEKSIQGSGPARATWKTLRGHWNGSYRNKVVWHGLHTASWREGQVTGFYEHGDEPSWKFGGISWLAEKPPASQGFCSIDFVCLFVRSFIRSFVRSFVRSFAVSKAIISQSVIQLISHTVSQSVIVRWSVWQSLIQP